MNFRIFGVYIIVLGLIVAAYGGYELYQVEAEFQKDMGYARAEGSWSSLYTPGIEDRAAEARKEPIKILGVGGLIVILGIGMAAAAKGKKPDKESSVKPSEPKSSSEPKFPEGPLKP